MGEDHDGFCGVKSRVRNAVMRDIGKAEFVMAGLVPAIHVLLLLVTKDVDARHKAGHDERD